MKFYILILSLIIAGLSQPEPAKAAQTSLNSKCVQYANLKSRLSSQEAEKSCSRVKNAYALACSKIALTYLYRANQKSLIQSCSRIKSEKGLKCVVNTALNAKKYPAKLIRRCS